MILQPSPSFQGSSPRQKKLTSMIDIIIKTTTQDCKSKVLIFSKMKSLGVKNSLDLPSASWIFDPNLSSEHQRRCLMSAHRPFVNLRIPDEWASGRPWSKPFNVVCGSTDSKAGEYRVTKLFYHRSVSNYFGWIHSRVRYHQQVKTSSMNTSRSSGFSQLEALL